MLAVHVFNICCNYLKVGGSFMEAIKLDKDNVQDVLETRQEVSNRGEKGKLFHISLSFCSTET